MDSPVPGPDVIGVSPTKSRVPPIGTVTFLFTDIEGSTRLLEVHADDYPWILAHHRELIRAAVAAEDGVEVDTTGDALFFVFPSAVSAVRGAAAAQGALASTRWPGDASVRVRMGLHTGEVGEVSRDTSASMFTGERESGRPLMADRCSSASQPVRLWNETYRPAVASSTWDTIA